MTALAATATRTMSCAAALYVHNQAGWRREPVTVAILMRNALVAARAQKSHYDTGFSTQA